MGLAICLLLLLLLPALRSLMLQQTGESWAFSKGRFRQGGTALELNGGLRRLAGCVTIIRLHMSWPNWLV